MHADLPCPAAPLRLSLDAAALAANWRTLDQMSGAAQAGAAVKADAYGTGVARAVRILAEAGCRDFFVAHWQEADDVRALVPAESISVLHGPASEADAVWAKETGVRPVLNSLAQVAQWRASGGGVCHLMVDTGMNRLGVGLHELGDPLLDGLQVDILLSHLASAEEDTALNDVQRERWQSARNTLPHLRASLANSAGITLGQDYHGDLTRPGLALYGGVPCTALAGRIRQVIAPEAAILQVRRIEAGDTVGYNATFTAKAPMRIGTIALGYADGYLRCWSGRGTVRLAGQQVPVLGRVSMDLTIIDLTDIAEAAEGDWVTVDYDLPAASATTGLSQYELLTLLGRRFSR